MGTTFHPDAWRRLARDIEVAKNYSPAARKQAAADGAAMPDGSYPIYNRTDLGNAIKDYNRTGQPASVKEHIVKRAKALGAPAPFQDA